MAAFVAWSPSLILWAPFHDIDEMSDINKFNRPQFMLRDVPSGVAVPLSKLFITFF
jgi:hypothetical protein